METDQPGGAPGSSAPPPAPPSPSAEKLSDGEKFLEDLKNVSVASISVGTSADFVFFFFLRFDHPD